MGINGGTGIVSSGSVLGGSGISLPKGGGGGTPPFSFGNALNPDGFNDLITLPSGGIVVGTNDFTFSGWVKINLDYNQYLLKGVGSFSINKSLFSVGDSLAGRNFTIPTQTLGNWFHFMFAFDYAAQKGRVYINGVESSTGAITVRLNRCTFDTLIEQNTPVVVRDFVVDEFAIWRGTKGTLQNAVDLYNGGNGALASDVIPSPTAYWRMNEADGSLTLVDETGNYNGTLTNFSSPPAYFIPH